MNWQDLIAFIQAKNPDFLATVKGVSQDEIARWEKKHSFTLPRLYVDFLLTMGRSSGDFNPLGVYAQNFDQLPDYLPDESYSHEYPAGRYCLIGYVDDENAISPFELFLDLERSDGQDAPLIEMGSNGVYIPEARHETGRTLGELLASRVFRFFELKHRADREMVLSSVNEFEKRKQMDAAVRNQTLQREKQSFVDFLTGLKLELALPSLPQFACLHRNDLSACIKINNESFCVIIDLGGDNRDVVHRTANQLLAAFPGSSRHKHKLS